MHKITLSFATFKEQTRDTSKIFCLISIGYISVLYTDKPKRIQILLIDDYYMG